MCASMPIRRRQAAAVRPPMPAPMMAMWGFFSVINILRRAAWCPDSRRPPSRGWLSWSWTADGDFGFDPMGIRGASHGHQTRRGSDAGEPVVRLHAGDAVPEQRDVRWAEWFGAVYLAQGGRGGAASCLEIAGDDAYGCLYPNP